MKQVAFALLLLLSGLSDGARAACAPLGMDRAALELLKTSGFETADASRRDRMLLAMADCLGDPDPALRDGIAYEGYVRWLRDDVDATTLRRLRTVLYRALEKPDSAGVRAPFAALVLAEVARNDRRHPWMSADERADMVERAARYLESVADYRGFEPGIGWRHGVAHGADWVAAVARQPALSATQARRLLDAIAIQSVPASGHAYIHGESARLAAAVLAITASGVVSDADWKAWLARLPERLGDPTTAWKSAGWLAKRHDLQGLLMALHVGSDTDADPRVRALKPLVRQALADLP